MGLRERKEYGNRGIKLSQDQEAFAQASYAASSDTTQADIYNHVKPGLSLKACRSGGWRYSNMANIKARISELRSNMSVRLEKKTTLAVADAIQALAYNIDFDPRKLQNEDGSMKNIADLDEPTALALKSFTMKVVESDAGTTTEYKYQWHDKNQSVNLLLQKLGEIGGNTGGDGDSTAQDPLSRLSGTPLFARITEVFVQQSENEHDAGRIFEHDQGLIEKKEGEL